MSSIIYRTDGKGNWWRTETQPQCSAEDLFGPQCQGVLGHLGVHWAYKPNGSYAYWLNESDPGSIEKDIGGGWIPPDNESYIHPKDKKEEYYMHFHSTEKIEDAALIRMLESENAPEKNATIDRPLSHEEVKRLKSNGIL